MTYKIDHLELARDPDRLQSAPTAVVGIGASAGGLKALQRFFESVPADSGMAFVVIMHLDPERESRIAELLQDRTAVPVTQVTADTTVQADRIYVIPPSHDLAIAGNTIRIQDRGGRPQHAPVDLFLRTLAEAYGADAIGVLLSGTGTDGTDGIRFIKERGGITSAQTPAEADYEGMPASAIASGQIDLVLPAAEIPIELLRLMRMPSTLHSAAPPPDTEAQLSRVFAALRGKTGHDFSRYKRSMVLRRLERRLGFAGVSTLEEYLPLLQKGPAEIEALVRDLLISVSGFFRDPDAFGALNGAIPALFEGKESDGTVRVWVVGCATGEEAYSLAILLNEHAATLENPPRIQIFATDIDEHAYSQGREGLYSAAAVAEIPSERLRRFFTQEAGHYRVAKVLREGVLFAVHNVLHDAPFSKVDLISCRNLLIYLQPDAQAQAVETFHYALRPDGLLFLGKAETAGESGLFTPISEPQRLYRRDAAAHVVLPRLSSADPSPRRGAPPAGPPEDGGDTTAERFSYGALHLRMLETYGPPSLIVDEALNVVHRSERSGRYLHLGGGVPTHNLIDLSRGDLRVELRTALYQAFEKGLPAIGRVRIDDADNRVVNLQVHPPLAKEKGARRFAMVVFDEAAEVEPVSAAAEGTGQRETVAFLEAELRRKREQLETTSAAYERTVEELQSANEEMQSVNEEQKAAAEELETSREEIQSMNEELTTINQEHQNTIEELKRTNADLQNLIASTEIATIFLDGAMRIRRFTPAASALFNFVDTDQGRPLSHITHRLDYPELVEEVQGVLTSLVRSEREVSSDDGESYIVRINPYRSVDDDVDGAIITFFDHTAQKRVEDELREAKAGADAASLVKGTFLATASHEFRTPLTGILGYAELLGLDGTLTPAQEHQVGRITALGRHLASLIDEILTIAQLRSGGHAIDWEWVDAGEIAREAALLVEPAARAKGLALILDLPDGPSELETDRRKLRHVLVNLCGNAVKFSDRGEVRLRVRPEEAHIAFEVRDTGLGIAPEHLSRIFHPFWQVDDASTRPAEGMGIGLATVEEYTRLLSGYVEVKSEIGSGSTFRLRLPRKREEATDREGPDARLDPRPRET
jgi:two-component system, chemotaxis family, CheB/CheR fusion protein